MRGRSAFPTNASDRARGRSALSTDASDRAEERTAFCTGGRDRPEERARFLPTRAFVPRVGRLFAPGIASVPEGGRLFLLTATIVRRTDGFLYRWVRSCKASGGFSYRCAPFRRGSDDIFDRFASFVRSPGRFPNTPLHWRTRRCRFSYWSLFPPAGPEGHGVNSCTMAFHIVNFCTGRCTKRSVIGAIQLPARPGSPRIHQHRRWGCPAGV